MENVMVIRNKIFEYVKKEYNTTPEYLWKKYPDYAVLRHNDNRKWYAVIMNISKDKLGSDGKDKIEIINLKCYPEMIGSLRKEIGVFPAYHMNKEYWISIILDGTFSEEKLFALLDLSFQITQ